MKEKIEVTQLSVKLKESDYKALQKMAAKSHKPMAEIARSHILQGMGIEKTRDDIDFIRKQIREELNAVMYSYMNRTIKLLIKIGTMTITMCFFTSKLLYVLIAKHKSQEEYDEMLSDAKRKAAAFLSLRDETINEASQKILHEERG